MKKVFLFMMLLSLCLFSATDKRQEQKKLLTAKMKEAKIKQESITYFYEAVASGESTNKYEELMLKAIKADPKNYYALDNLGVYYRAVKNNPDKAIEYYKKSIAVNPDNAFPYMNMGAAYLFEKDFENAEKSYIALTESIPDYPEGYYGLAQIYLMKGDSEKAIISAKQAKEKYLNLDPKKYFEEAEFKEIHLVDCEFIIGYANYLSGNYQEAIDGFFNILSVMKVKKPDLLNDFATIAYEANQKIKKNDLKKYEGNNKKFKAAKLSFE